ncbi:hypothetical protein Btru_051431 [Bulinus truncatus]|nr:hypothetical protein Btru_051431 [Bulinus truncatus]
MTFSQHRISSVEKGDFERKFDTINVDTHLVLFTMSRYLSRLRQLIQSIKVLPYHHLAKANATPGGGAPSKSADTDLVKPISALSQRMSYSGAAGDGAGKGGGSGGSIRSAGGAFGKREAGIEEKYFHDEEVRQLKEFKTKMKDLYRKQLSAQEQKILNLTQEMKNLQDDEKKNELQEEIKAAELEVKKIQDKMKEIEKTSE